MNNILKRFGIMVFFSMMCLLCISKAIRTDISNYKDKIKDFVTDDESAAETQVEVSSEIE